MSRTKGITEPIVYNNHPRMYDVYISLVYHAFVLSIIAYTKYTNNTLFIGFIDQSSWYQLLITTTIIINTIYNLYYIISSLYF